MGREPITVANQTLSQFVSMTKLQPKLILASQSPRRRQLLKDAGFEFSVQAAPEEVEESFDGRNSSPTELVVELSLRKAKWVAAQHRHGVVIAADTIAECGNELLGKPANRIDAKRMLNLMSGKQHFVHTGVTLLDCSSGRIASHLETTQLVMDLLQPRELERYLDSDGWQGKAGAFGYQDDLDWVHVVDGLESNVVGFPVERLANWIDALLQPG